MMVLNHDIVNLVRRMRRFKEEMIKSVSHGVSELNEHDLLRLESYISAIKFFHQWTIDQPQLDLPETSPQPIEVGEMPASPMIENDDLQLIVKLFDLIETELVNSQSARRSTGMIDHDSIRFTTYIEKIEAFLMDFVQNTNPLDLPESTPAQAISGPGRTGI